MSNRLSNSAKRKIAILQRATAKYLNGNEHGCSMNHKWCFALTNEQAVKDMIKDGLMYLKRQASTVPGRQGTTLGYATPKGREYLKKMEKRIERTL